MYPFETWPPQPSTTSGTPISSRDDSASILSGGRRSMKSATLPEKNATTARGTPPRGDTPRPRPRHPDRRDHGIEREDDVQQDDLREDPAEARVLRRGAAALLAGRTLELVVDLERRLPDQEEPAE